MSILKMGVSIAVLVLALPFSTAQLTCDLSIRFPSQLVCSGHGVCDSTVGRCICDDGWSARADLFGGSGCVTNTLAVTIGLAVCLALAFVVFMRAVWRLSEIYAAERDKIVAEQSKAAAGSKQGETQRINNIKSPKSTAGPKTASYTVIDIKTPSSPAVASASPDASMSVSSSDDIVVVVPVMDVLTRVIKLIREENSTRDPFGVFCLTFMYFWWALVKLAGPNTYVAYDALPTIISTTTTFLFWGVSFMHFLTLCETCLKVVVNQKNRSDAIIGQLRAGFIAAYVLNFVSVVLIYVALSSSSDALHLTMMSWHFTLKSVLLIVVGPVMSGFVGHVLLGVLDESIETEQKSLGTNPTTATLARFDAKVVVTTELRAHLRKTLTGSSFQLVISLMLAWLPFLQACGSYFLVVQSFVATFEANSLLRVGAAKPKPVGEKTQNQGSKVPGSQQAHTGPSISVLPPVVATIEPVAINIPLAVPEQ